MWVLTIPERLKCSNFTLHLGTTCSHGWASGIWEDLYGVSLMKFGAINYGHSQVVAVCGRQIKCTGGFIDYFHFEDFTLQISKNHAVAETVTL